jgi:hypothetical protein
MPTTAFRNPLYEIALLIMLAILVVIRFRMICRATEANRPEGKDPKPRTRDALHDEFLDD